jgi:hypothetical protein
VLEYVDEEPQENQVAPQTPRTASEALEWLGRSLRATLTPALLAPSPSPAKTPFLNRFSNTTGFLVNDIDEKVGRMDSEWQRVREFMESAERNGDSVKEELELSKKRGGHCIY